MSLVTGLPASAKEMYRDARRLRMDMQSGDSTITWLVADEDIVDFLMTVGGTVEVVGGIGGVVTRVVPLQHPTWTWMYAKSIDDQEYGLDPETGTRYHKVTVTFGNLPWPTDGSEAFMSRVTNPSVRSMDLPKGGVTIGGIESGVDRSNVVNGFDMSITIHQMPYSNEAAWYSVAGTVNSAGFFGVPPGYVKYIGPSMSTSVTFGGTRTWEITHNFSFSPIQWNYEFDESGELGLCLVNGVPRYGDLDFTVLFN